MKKTILKSDHVLGCQNKRMSPQIEGAPNYRQVKSGAFSLRPYSLPIHGVASTTTAGIRNVLRHIGAHKDGKQLQVLWISLREEPVIYINGRPFVLRDAQKPFTNLDNTGINRVMVEQMEARLKEDILMESSRYGNKILVTDELPDGQMVDQWEPVTTDSLKTLLEVYEELQAEGYLVNYERVPVTDEKSPKETDFDALIRKICQADINTEIIFNCQMGSGRTTTGMVIATLVYYKRTGASDQGFPINNSFGRIFKDGENSAINLPNPEEAIRRGEYAVVRSLIRVLQGGVEGKRLVDQVIDKCESMQNVRKAIATYRSSILHQIDEKKREAALSFFVEYLERYYFLICFAVYLHSEGDSLQSSSLSHVSFADWMRARPELYSILSRLLRRDPMGALGYAAMKPLTKIAESTDGRPHEMSVVAALRSGAVLGSQTVLKSDYSPDCHFSGLRERVEGAPNFREVPGFPVYGVANPTIHGIRSVIERVWSLRGIRPVFWHNMREEPVVYINGGPFVIRDVERPYKNMLEYKRIDRDTVEGMEASLKEDILREAKRYDGAIMVIHEAKDGHIFYLWEHVKADSVQTPLEVYKCLEADGFPIKYARVPITDGKAPKSSDFDTLTSNIAFSSRDTAFVFNCQMGRGRTTFGTVIACLVKLRINCGRPIKVLYDVLTYPIVDNEETGINNVETRPRSSRSSTEEEHGRTFGIDDILLLWKITRLFDNGVESREALDAVIDRCSQLQNIREAVLQYRKVFNRQNVEARVRSAALKRGTEYLDRYFRLIAFAAYLGNETLDEFFVEGGSSKITFKKWLHQRPEVLAMKWSTAQFFTIPEELRAQHRDALMESIFNKRCGPVLGKGSILKMYFFPGQRTPSRLQINEDGGDSIERKREEAVVYINGTPFALRELSKPVDTFKYVGITGAVVENIETRLKEEILSEIRETGGRMLLHREEYSSTSNLPLFIGYWENIQPENVKTPAEVYASLKNENYNISCRSLPWTRERDELASDVDAIQFCKDDSLEVVAKMDRISSLPSDVILMIVRFLSAKEAARLLVLSKNYQNLFAITPDINFDIKEESLTSFLDRMLAMPVMTTRIRKVSLKCDNHVDSEDYGHLNNCVRHILKLGVMDFELSICGENGYSLPLEVFTCKTVIKLKLGNFFAIDVLPKNALLPALETLILDSVRFHALHDCAFQALLFASPELKELMIDGMNWETWEWSGILASQSLQRLSIGRVFSGEYDGPHNQRISFDTPSLAYLEYTDFVPHEYPTVNFQSLVEVKLNLHLVVNPQWDERFPHDGDVYSSNPAKLIKGVRNVKILELSSSFNFEALNFFRRAIPVFEFLNLLTLNHVDIGYCWGFLPFLLKKSPNLKTLIIKGGLHCAEEPDYVCSCLSGYSCLWSSTIEVLEITLGQGGTVAELEQLKHFLGKLSSLQLLQVGSWKDLSPKFISDLLKLPRASSKCKIQNILI